MKHRPPLHNLLLILLIQYFAYSSFAHTGLDLELITQHSFSKIENESQGDPNQLMILSAEIDWAHERVFYLIFRYNFHVIGNSSVARPPNIYRIEIRNFSDGPLEDDFEPVEWETYVNLPSEVQRGTGLDPQHTKMIYFEREDRLLVAVNSLEPVVLDLRNRTSMTLSLQNKEIQNQILKLRPDFPQILFGQGTNNERTVLSHFEKSPSGDLLSSSTCSNSRTPKWGIIWDTNSFAPIRVFPMHTLGNSGDHLAFKDDFNLFIVTRDGNLDSKVSIESTTDNRVFLLDKKDRIAPLSVDIGRSESLRLFLHWKEAQASIFIFNQIDNDGPTGRSTLFVSNMTDVTSPCSLALNSDENVFRERTPNTDSNAHQVEVSDPYKYDNFLSVHPDEGGKRLAIVSAHNSMNSKTQYRFRLYGWR